MSDRRIYLGMPGYGKQTADAGRAFWRACRDMSQVTCDYRAGSLLASNFNQLWCGALNRVHHGEHLKRTERFAGTLAEAAERIRKIDREYRIDYFAMLHDDIGAEDFWLDKLIDELEAKNLDVLGAVAPIKDRRGITSLAVHRDGDNWMPQGRLTMHDVHHELPETFTSDELTGPLLLNTGCWVCRFDMKWADKVHFEINDRIVFNRALNRYQAQTEPEDWFFSRLCHEQGLKIGATRKVRMVHRGEMDFTNAAAWGTHKYDSEHSRTSVVKGAFPHDIKGWLTPDEGAELSRLATGKRVLEIGSYCGASTVCLARTAEHVTAVDYFDGRGTPVPGNTLPAFTANIERYGVADKVRTCHPDDPYPLPEYDLAFIDGAHDHESVMTDIQRATDVLAPDGLLVFHDYMEPTDPGVTTAVSTLLLGGAKILSKTGSLAVVKPAHSLTEQCNGSGYVS